MKQDYLEILQERLVRGEINIEEFYELKKVIEGEKDKQKLTPKKDSNLINPTDLNCKAVDENIEPRNDLNEGNSFTRLFGKLFSKLKSKSDFWVVLRWFGYGYLFHMMIAKQGPPLPLYVEVLVSVGMACCSSFVAYCVCCFLKNKRIHEKTKLQKNIRLTYWAIGAFLLLGAYLILSLLAYPSVSANGASLNFIFLIEFSLLLTCLLCLHKNYYHTFSILAAIHTFIPLSYSSNLFFFMDNSWYFYLICKFQLNCQCWGSAIDAFNLKKYFSNDYYSYAKY